MSCAAPAPTRLLLARSSRELKKHLHTQGGNKKIKKKGKKKKGKKKKHKLNRGWGSQGGGGAGAARDGTAGPDVRGCSAPAGRPHQIHLQPPPRTTHQRGKNIAGLSNEIIPTSPVHAQCFLAAAPSSGPRGAGGRTEAAFIRPDGRPRARHPPAGWGAATQSTFLQPRGGQSHGHHPA